MRYCNTRAKIEPVKIEKRDSDPEVTLVNMKTEVCLDDDAFDLNITQLHEEVDIKSEDDASVTSLDDMVVDSVPQGKILEQEDQVLHSNEEKGLLSCYHCNYSADHKTLLIDHMKAHKNGKHAHMDSTNESIINRLNSVTTKSSAINDRPFLKRGRCVTVKHLRCECCDVTFSRKTSLDQHTLRKHPQFISSVTSKIHECKICTYKTTAKRRFDNHMRKHSGEPSLEIRSCVFCNARFLSKMSSDNHILRKHPEFIEIVTSKIHECRFCIYKTTNKSHINIHMLNHSKTKSNHKVSNCNLCDKKFVVKRTLDEHMLRKHPNFIESVTSKIHESKMCNFKTTLKASLNKHMVLQHAAKADYKLIKCMHCDAEFRSKLAMDNHILKNHPECIESVTSKIHECNLCDFKAVTKGEFKEHMFKHPEARTSYSFSRCNHCEATFKIKRALDAHILKTHPEFIASIKSPIHQCHLCPYKTIWKYNLDLHIRRHPNRPGVHTCSVCNAEFASRGAVNRHMTNKHKQRLSQLCSSSSGVQK